MYRKLLVPVDGSKPSTAALLELVKITAHPERVIRLVHVVDQIHWQDEFEGGSVGETLLATRRNSGTQCLADAKLLMAGQHLECECLLLESHGERAAEVIVAHAKAWPADLIVMGTHGRRGIGRLVLGSDAADVIRSAPTAVLMVRGN